MTLFLFVINPYLSPRGSITAWRKAWGGYLFRSVPREQDPRSNLDKTWIQVRRGELRLKLVRSRRSSIIKTKVWPVPIKWHFVVQFGNHKLSQRKQQQQQTKYVFQLHATIEFDRWIWRWGAKCCVMNVYRCSAALSELRCWFPAEAPVFQYERDGWRSPRRTPSTPLHRHTPCVRRWPLGLDGLQTSVTETVIG